MSVALSYCRPVEQDRRGLANRQKALHKTGIMGCRCQVDEDRMQLCIQRKLMLLPACKAAT